MSSIRPRVNSDGSVTYQVLYRVPDPSKASGFRQPAQSFANYEAALKWQALLDKAGHEQALKVLRTVADPGSLVTVSELCMLHIEQLTGMDDGTLRKYESYVRNDIDPTIGALPVAVYSIMEDARWVKSLCAKGNAWKTVKNKHGFLSSAMQTGVRLKEIPLDSNPCRGRRLGDSDHKEMVIFSPGQFVRFLQFVPHFWQPLTRFLVMTGLRWGECTALLPRDFDRDKRTVTVNRAWKYTSGRGHRLGPPKTENSYRTLELDDDAWGIVEPRLIGPAGRFIFTNTRGGPVRGQNFHNQVWRVAVWYANACVPPNEDEFPDFVPPHWLPKASHGIWAGVEPAKPSTSIGLWPRVHDMRHTNISWMIADNHDLLAISRHAGHNSIHTTTKVYGHMMPGRSKPLISGVSRQLRAAEAARREIGRPGSPAA